jgi:hypothetical protein
MKNQIQYVFILVVFLLGLYYCSKVKSKTIYEGYENKNSNCPDILIQKGTKIYLYDSKKAKIPGVNPIIFNNLEEYTEYLDWQKNYNINCPILFLQHSYDAQGNGNYQVRPSPYDLQGGLPSTVPAGEQAVKMTKLTDAGRNDPPYNKNSYPAYDPMNLNQGEYTPLDKMYHIQEQTKKYSDNPMDSNWGGEEYTDQVVASGKYSGNEVYLATA